MSKVDGILNLIAVMGHDHRNCDDGCATKAEFKNAKSQLLELMLECVGEDEKLISHSTAFMGRTDHDPFIRNKLRYEIRTNIHKAFGVDLPLDIKGGPK